MSLWISHVRAKRQSLFNAERKSTHFLMLTLIGTPAPEILDIRTSLLSDK